MTRQQTIVPYTAAVFLLLAAGSGATPQMFGTGQQICNYQYAIPHDGNCVTYGPALERKLDAVQQDMDRTKLQYVSENSVLREELRKLNQQSSATDINLQDLTKEVKNLQTALTALQEAQSGVNGYPAYPNTGSAIPSAAMAMLEQLVKTTQAQLTQGMIKLEHQLNQAEGAMQARIMQDGIQQSKVDQAFQAQLRQQQIDLTSVMQRVQQIDIRVNQLQRVTPSPNPPYPTVTAHLTTATAAATSPPSTTSTPSTTTTQKTTAAGPTSAGTTQPNLQVQQLQQELQALKTRLTQLEASYNVVIPDLKRNVSHLTEMTANQSLAVSDLKLEVDFIVTQKLPDLEQKVDTSYQALADLRRDFPPLEHQVQAIAGNVSSFATQLTSMGFKVFEQISKLRADETKINTLGSTVAALEAQLQSYGITTGAPLPTTVKVPPRPTTVFPFPTRRPTSSSG